MPSVAVARLSVPAARAALRLPPVAVAALRVPVALAMQLMQSLASAMLSAPQAVAHERWPEVVNACAVPVCSHTTPLIDTLKFHPACLGVANEADDASPEELDLVDDEVDDASAEELGFLVDDEVGDASAEELGVFVDDELDDACDELDADSDGSADAAHGIAASPAPMPSATASPPTWPT